MFFHGQLRDLDVILGLAGIVGMAILENRYQMFNKTKGYLVNFYAKVKH